MAKGFELRGFKELTKKLHELGPKIEKKLLRAAVRQASNVVLRAARANAPVEEGDLKRSIRVKSLRTKPGRVRFAVVAEVRAEPSAKYPEGYPYAIGVEKGHGLPGTRGRLFDPDDPKFAAERSEAITRHMEFGSQTVPPHPFMRPAWDANKENILTRLREELGKGIERLAQEKA